MIRNIIFLFILIGLYALTSCHSVYNVKKASPTDVDNEGTIVFVRPVDHTVLGTKSLNNYIEITYEEALRNDAGLLQINVGIRNKGGTRIYDTKGPNFQLSVKTACYDKPFSISGHKSAPVYETNWKTITLLRGASEHYKIICPVKSATHYQVTISELLK